MTPDADSFAALARSSPWRWRSVVVRARSEGWGEVEARVDRPDRLRVVASGRSHHITDTLGAGVSMSVAWDGVGERPAPAPVVWRWIGDVAPQWRPDGLVARRPEGLGVEAGDLMWSNYAWVAAFDPVELSHGVTVTEVRADRFAGRPVWRAVVAVTDAYDPRCACCPLLPSLVADRHEYGDAVDPARSYPDAFDVRLDLGTGIAVSIDPLGVAAGEWDSARSTIEIVEVPEATG